MEKKIAIIGAGLSGLAAAFQLAQSGAEICLFEKSKGLSGRAASRSKNGCRYDCGANYFKVESTAVARLLFQSLSTEGLCRILGDIDTFDESGTVTAGDPEQNTTAKWTYRDGISTMGKRIVAAAGLKVIGETLIIRMERSRGKWHLESETGGAYDDFDAVLLTPPAPQTTDLLEASDFDRGLREGIVTELRRSQYHRQHTVVLNFHGRFSLPRDAYALINSDRRHDITWISHENRKPGHVPEGETLLIVQMSPSWSLKNFERPGEEVAAAAHALSGQIFGSELPPPRWADFQRWRFAHPVSPANYEKMKEASPLGLFFAGDAFVGKGRIAGAIESGFRAAREIGEFQATR